MATQPSFLQSIKTAKAQILPATGTTAVTIYTGATNGSKLFGLSSQASITTSVTIVISMLKSAVVYNLISWAANSGQGALATVPLPMDSDGNPYMLLASGDIIQANVTLSLSSGQLDLIAVVGDF